MSSFELSLIKGIFKLAQWEAPFYFVFSSSAPSHFTKQPDRSQLSAPLYITFPSNNTSHRSLAGQPDVSPPCLALREYRIERGRIYHGRAPVRPNPPRDNQVRQPGQHLEMCRSPNTYSPSRLCFYI